MLTFELMSPQGTPTSDSNNNNKNGKTKPVSVLPMVSALIAAAILVSGLSLIGNYGYHSAMAQQQNTTEESGGGVGSISTTASNTTSTEGSATIAQGGNATTTEGGGGGANLSTSELRTNLEQALTALQNNDTQTATMYLELTLDAMGGADATEGNTTSSSTAARAGINANTTVDEEDVISMGGTGAIDDYDATADD
jgi:cytoskeletal protein RodZ